MQKSLLTSLLSFSRCVSFISIFDYRLFTEISHHRAAVSTNRFGNLGNYFFLPGLLVTQQRDPALPDAVSHENTHYMVCTVPCYRVFIDGCNC